jgi:hypothetical protein
MYLLLKYLTDYNASIWIAYVTSNPTVINKHFDFK